MADALLPMPRSVRARVLRSSGREAHQPTLLTMPRTHRPQSGLDMRYVLGGSEQVPGRIQGTAGVHCRSLGPRQDTLRCWQWPTPQCPIP